MKSKARLGIGFALLCFLAVGIGYLARPVDVLANVRARYHPVVSTDADGTKLMFSQPPQVILDALGVQATLGYGRAGVGVSQLSLVDHDGHHATMAAPVAGVPLPSLSGSPKVSRLPAKMWCEVELWGNSGGWHDSRGWWATAWSSLKQRLGFK